MKVEVSQNEGIVGGVTESCEEIVKLSNKKWIWFGLLFSRSSCEMEYFSILPVKAEICRCL